MTGNVTITFSQTGVQPPVYVTTSLSGWTTLEMDVDDKTASDNIVFSKEFRDVPEGSHQYKIRIGEDHWVLDESKETATNDQGIRNNVVQVMKPSPELPIKLAETRKDSIQDQLPSPEVPTLLVEKEIDPPKSPEIPTLVVEKTEDKPAYGDDFGQDATNAQKVAHDMRAADASPDRLVITPESHVEPDNSEEQVPLFRHESFQVDEPSATPSADTIDEESLQSSADQTSSGDAMDTPSEPEDAQDDDKLQHEPLFSHETDIGEKSGELENGPLLSHEAELDDVETDEDDDELDRFPLLSHETGFSGSKGSEIVTKSDFLEDEENNEPQHYGPYDEDDEYDCAEGDDGDAPLLPHERDAAVSSNAGSDMSSDDAHFSLQNQPTFGYETDNARQLFAGSGRPNFFKTRTNSSCLPHKLPLSDEEDENLNDPSLERFPTHRDQILERVATIGLHLPEDEAMENHHLHSPQLSQACSSVDLVPVKSYTSLASVPEAENSDDEEGDEDEESLGSPVFINSSTARMAGTSSSFACDPCATPVPDDSKQLGYKDEAKPKAPSSRTTDSSEADSIDKHDGAKDISSVISALRDAVTTPAKLLNPTTPPPAMFENKSTAKEVHTVSNLDSELRQRRAHVEGSSRTSETSTTIAADGVTVKNKIVGAISPALAQQPENRDEGYLQHFLRVVFGPVGRFLTACVGDRKRASVSATVVFGVAAAYYFIASAR